MLRLMVILKPRLLMGLRRRGSYDEKYSKGIVLDRRRIFGNGMASDSVGLWVACFSCEALHREP